jgi:hypothetical protein
MIKSATIRELEDILWRTNPASVANKLTAGEFTIPRHIAYLSEAITDALAGDYDRLAIFAPIRHGKSFLVSHWTPVTALSLDPTSKIILASYESDFAAEWGRLVRNTIEEHSGVLGVRLSEDSQAARRWNTPEGGGMIATGIGGGFTGRGFNLGIVDDPIKSAEDANSKLMRDRAWEWYRSTFSSRMQPNRGLIILMMARWHEDDLAGRIEKSEDAGRWKFIRLPAIAEASDPLGRKEGEALWPAMWPIEKLKAKRIEMGEYWWEALCQQNPPSMKGDRAYGHYNPAEGENRDSRIKLIRGLPLQMDVDFNRRPGMHAGLGQYLPHEDLLTTRHIIHAPGMTIRQMIGNPESNEGKIVPGSLRDYIQKYGGWQWERLEVFGDATGRITQYSDGKSSWQWIAEELKVAKIPYKLKIPGSNPGVKDRVNAVNNALRTADNRILFKFHPDCHILHNDFTSMYLEDNELSSEDQTVSHASAALGYRICWLIPIRKLKIKGGHVGVLQS